MNDVHKQCVKWGELVGAAVILTGMVLGAMAWMIDSKTDQPHPDAFTREEAAQIREERTRLTQFLIQRLDRIERKIDRADQWEGREWPRE